MSTLLHMVRIQVFQKKLAMWFFDAHYDLRDEFADIKLSHASYLRRNCRRERS